MTKNNGIKSVALAVIAPFLTAATAATPDQPYAYVSNVFTNRVSVVDTTTNSVLKTIAVPSPTGIAVSADRSALYVAGQTSSVITVIDTSSNEIIASIKLSSQPTAISLSPNESQLYVISPAGNRATVIDTASNSVIASITVGSRPSAIAFSADGSRAYVTNLWSNDVSVIDTTAQAVVKTFSAGSGPSGVAVTPDGKAILVTNEYGSVLTVHDAASGALLHTIGGLANPNDITIGPDGKSVYVTNAGNSSLSVIDTKTWAISASTSLGNAALPTSIALNPNGTRAYVTNQQSASLVVIDTGTKSIVGTVSNLGGHPVAVAISRRLNKHVPGSSASEDGSGGELNTSAGVNSKGMLSSTIGRKKAATSTGPVITSESTIPVVRVGTTHAFAATCTGTCTWSLASGSAGSIDPVTGIYTAPASVVAKNSLGGCPFPNNHILNTRIDGLPVHPNNAVYQANFALPPYTTYDIPAEFPHNVVDETYPYTDLTNPSTFLNALRGEYGTYQVPWDPNGTGLVEGGLLQLGRVISSLDQAIITVNHQTCWDYELYRFYPNGVWPGEAPNVWTEVGYRAPTMNLDLPIEGAVDVGGVPLAPLLLKLDDFYSGSINHAIPLTMTNGHIQSGFTWPGTETSASVVSGSAGTVYPQFGSRIRLSASFVAPQPSASCSITCVQYLNMLYRAYKQYGSILTDGGSNWWSGVDPDIANDLDARQALTEFSTAVTGANPRFRNWFEVVDTSQLLQTASVVANSGATSVTLHHSFWNNAPTRTVTCTPVAASSVTRNMVDDSITFSPALTQSTTCTAYNDHSGWTRPDSGYVTPDNYTQVIVTDGAGSTAIPVTIQPITIGLQDSRIIIQSGVSKQLVAWVNGTTNTGITWSVSRYAGSISSNGTFTAPTVTSPMPMMITATSQADPNVTAKIKVTVIPAGTFGVNIGGKTAASAYKSQFDANGTFTDSSGTPWYLFGSNGSRTFSDRTGSGTCFTNANPGNTHIPVDLTGASVGGSGILDAQHKFYVPNGSYKVTVDFGKYVTISGYYAEATLAANGVTGKYRFMQQNRPACQVVPVSIPAIVTDNTLTLSIRFENAYGTYDSYFSTEYQAIKIEKDTGAPRLTIDTPIGANNTVYWNTAQRFYAIPWAGLAAGATWSVDVGSIDSNGVWTSPAPPLNNAPQTVTVTARSTANTSVTAQYQFTYAFGVLGVTTTGGSQMNRASQMQFTANLNGVAYSNVTWSVSPAGSISSTGMYTAPSTVSANTVVTLTATSLDDPTQVGSTQVTVLALPPAVRVNAGDGSGFTDSLGNVWAANRAYDATAPNNWGYVVDSGDSIGYSNGSVIFPGASTGTNYMYQSHFYDHVTNPTGHFHYVFPALPGGTYQVILHWGEWSASTLNNFNVVINGTTVASNVQPAATPLVAITQNYSVVIGDNQTIQIDFVANANSWASINGIEVIPH